MSTGSVWALQQEIVQALRSDTDLAALLGTPVPIYDTVPGGAQMPYLALGEWQFSDAGTDDGPGARHQFAIEVWSDYAGRKKVLEAGLIVEAALAAVPQLLDGHHLIELRSVSGRFVRQESERLSLGLLRFSAFTQPIT